MAMIKNVIKNEEGSVMLEFILVMPILLLLFGSAMLTFDLSQAKMRIQEANRNMAWTTGDRYDASLGGKAQEAVKEKYEERNKLEERFSGGTVTNYWKIGGGGYEMEDLEVKGVSELHVYQRPTNWGRLYTGNLELKMTQISGANLGAIALSSVLFPMDETKHYYEATYELTRGEGKKNPEAVVYHRFASKDNRLTDHFVLETYKICIQPFPYNDESLIYTGIEQIANALGLGSGASVMDLKLSLPSIVHYRVLWLLMGDLDIKDTWETLSGGFSKMFSSEFWQDLKSESSSLIEEIKTW